MKQQWALDFDPFMEWIGDKSNVRENTGYWKAMPKGPEYVFRVKCALSFCCNSENGSVTGELLKDILAAINNLNIFGHSATGLDPL